MRTFAFIDAANLFYRFGKTGLPWEVDYGNLFAYLKERYGAEVVYFFGGVEIYGFDYDYMANETLPLDGLQKYLLMACKSILGVCEQRLQSLRRMNALAYLDTSLSHSKLLGGGSSFIENSKVLAID